LLQILFNELVGCQSADSRPMLAKRKKQSKRPQTQHKPKSRSSPHDKRKRLATPNPLRKKTVKAKVPLTGMMAGLVTSMAGMLDARMAFRLSIIMAGVSSACVHDQNDSLNCPLTFPPRCLNATSRTASALTTTITRMP